MDLSWQPVAADPRIHLETDEEWHLIRVSQRHFLMKRRQGNVAAVYRDALHARSSFILSRSREFSSVHPFNRLSIRWYDTSKLQYRLSQTILNDQLSF